MTHHRVFRAALSVALYALLMLSPSSARPAYAGVPCITSQPLSSSSTSGSSDGCFRITVPANTSFLRLSLTASGGAYNLYHSQAETSFLSEWEKLNTDAIDSTADYAFIEPLPGPHTIGVSRVGSGAFQLNWAAVGEASLASNQPTSSCSGDVCTSAIPLTVDSGIRVGADFGDRLIVPVTIGQPGRITVRAEWQGAPRLALILNGPDRPELTNPVAFYQRVDGASPLTLFYNVSASDFQRGRKWRISLVNFTQSGRQSRGNIRIDYPATSVRDQPQRSTSFDDFTGTWRNVDAATRGMTRMTITRDGANLKVHTWGACTPSDCDHGETTVRLRGNPVEVSRDFGFLRETLTIWALQSGQVRVLSDNNFVDPNRRDYVAEHHFRRTFIVDPGPLRPFDPPRLVPPERLVPVPGPALLTRAEQEQVIQFNPGAALQKRIFADGFVPNSPEFTLVFANVAYIGQRAENLASGAVRVYYVRSGDWGNVTFVQRPNPTGSALGAALLNKAQQEQVIQFNPGAALQQEIFAAGFVPNSPEFSQTVSGATYAAQRAESLSTGVVRVYYVAVGDWANVRFHTRI
jgi:hypothetical protein